MFLSRFTFFDVFLAEFNKHVEYFRAFNERIRKHRAETNVRECINARGDLSSILCDRVNPIPEFDKLLK